MSVVVHVEKTPNPSSRKFVCNLEVADDTTWYGGPEDAAGDALAESLFSIEGVANVMFLNDFVTIGKTDDADWDELEMAIKKAIDDHYED